ncbi:hypothetical protein BST18_02365 [Mycobacteroides abscessus subsp. bolletii]|nr:hypothetical protein BST18_02365 [Mycobacteroides abscessus subsp. bolletii]BBB43353.1 hypothetical protein MASB_39190 [Mycobacteroides abscessus subsp. bolletii BD]
MPAGVGGCRLFAAVMVLFGAGVGKEIVGSVSLKVAAALKTGVFKASPMLAVGHARSTVGLIDQVGVAGLRDRPALNRRSGAVRIGEGNLGSEPLGANNNRVESSVFSDGNVDGAGRTATTALSGRVIAFDVKS